MCVYSEFIFCLLPRIAKADKQPQCAHAYDMPPSSSHRAPKPSFNAMLSKKLHSDRCRTKVRTTISVKLRAGLVLRCRIQIDSRLAPPLPRKSMLVQLCLGWCELLSWKCVASRAHLLPTLKLRGSGGKKWNAYLLISDLRKYCELSSHTNSA